MSDHSTTEAILFEPQEHSLTMRETSVEAFEQIRDSGLLSKERLRAYEAIVRHGSVTGSELNEVLGSKNAHKRLSELQRFGFICEDGTRQCRVTGRECISWIALATPEIPADGARVVPRPSRDDIVKTIGLMRGYYRKERDSGTAPGDEFIRVMRWLVFLTR